MLGTTISHYKVIEKIGQAGLGEGYRADHSFSSNPQPRINSGKWSAPITGLIISCLLFLCCVNSQGQVKLGYGTGKAQPDAMDKQDHVVRLGTPQQAQVEAATVSSLDQVIIELGPDDFVPGNLFDLEGKTLRFIPEGIGYRIEVLPLQWDSDFGTVIDGFPSIQVTLNNFQFPFSGTNWSTLFVNNFGSVSFGEGQNAFYNFGPDSSLRFQDLGGSLINTVPIISALSHLLGGYTFAIDRDDVNRMFVKELADRIVITWTISEPYSGVFDFILDPLLNRFQAVLHEDGTIVLSYDKVFVEDGIVGVFAISSQEQVLATLTDPVDPELPGRIDVLSVTVSLVGSTSIRFSFQTRGAILPEGDPTIDGILYRVYVDLKEPFFEGDRVIDADFDWGIFGSSELTYAAYGLGVSPNVEIDGDTISFTGSIGALAGVDQFAIFVDVVDSPNGDQTGNISVSLPDLPSLETDLSEASSADLTGDVVFEAFHYPDIPDVRFFTCPNIVAPGDQIDLFAFYTDFRVDKQRNAAVAGPSCSNRLTGFQTPVAIDTPVAAPFGVTSSGPYTNYNLQVSLLAHELGHNWLSLREAIVEGEKVDIGDNAPHWLKGLHAPSPFPVTGPLESSPMGGTYWIDNGDGTFIAETDSFLFPTRSYSYLDLYVMGLLPKDDVPDFFLIQNLAFIDLDSNGRLVYSGDRLDVTIEDVIAANGPRLPSFENSQKDFNLGLIGIVLPGDAPSPMLLERMAGIKEAFINYWSQATGGVSTMTDPLAPKTVLVANFVNGNDAELNSRVYLFNPSQSAGSVAVRVFTLPPSTDLAQELPGSPLNLGSLGARSALNLKLAEDILAPLGISLPYTDNEGDLTLEFTIGAANVRGATQVFSSSLAFGTNPLQEVPSTSSGSPTVLVANFMNGNNQFLNSRVYLWNPSQSAGNVTVRVFPLPLTDGLKQELTATPLNLGSLGSRSALNIKLAEEILIPLGIPTPYITDGGNLTLEITVQAPDVRGAAQVFSSDFAFGVYPLQQIPSTSSGSPTVLVANFMNGNNQFLNSRVYLWNPSSSVEGNVSVRVFSLPLKGGTAQELTTTPLDLGSLSGPGCETNSSCKSALNLKLAEDILTPLDIETPYTSDGGNLTLEFTITAENVRGAAQVFSSDFAFGTYPLQQIPSASSGSPTVLVANFVNGNVAALNSRAYLWNPSTSAGEVTVRVFTLPLISGSAEELTAAPLSLGSLAAKSAINFKLAEDILIPLGIPTPYFTDGGNLTLEFTITAANVRGVAQVFSSDLAFGTYPMQVIP